jgi:hypothetical protein
MKPTLICAVIRVRRDRVTRFSGLTWTLARREALRGLFEALPETGVGVRPRSKI